MVTAIQIPVWETKILLFFKTIVCDADTVIQIPVWTTVFTLKKNRLWRRKRNSIFITENKQFSFLAPPRPLQESV